MQARIRHQIASVAGATLLILSATSASAQSPSAPTGAADQAALDALKSRLAGTSVSIGTSASRNAALTGVNRTVQNLRDEFGMNVDYRELDSDPLVAALISNQMQVGQLSLAATIATREIGTDFVGFAGDDRNNVYIVAAKAPISSIEELRGQPFGATQNLQQITGQTARACLAAAGLDIESDVQLIRLSNTGDIMQALRAGQIAGGLTAPHRLWPAQVEEGVDAYNVLCRGSESANQLNNVWMASQAWVDANPDVALAIAISALRTGRWAHADKQGWMDLAMEIDDTLVPEAAELAYAEYVEGLDQWPVNGALDRTLCDAAITSAITSEVLTSELTCDDVVMFGFQDQALEILGAQ